jgi:hypothetical protein
MDKMKYVMIQNRILWLIVGSLFFMWAIPFGTFDPTKRGFYLCIALTIVIDVTTKYLLDKYRVKENNMP